MVDFLSSYGVAILIMVIAIAVAYKVNSATTYLFSSQCTAAPGFSCGYYSINENGILTIGIAQAIGDAIIVNGVACSSTAAQSGLPGQGNVYVANTVGYYPATWAPVNGVVIQSGGQVDFDLYCYNTANQIATSSMPGSSFVGDLWLNYTVQNTKIHNVQQVASVGLQYIVS